MKGDPNPSVVAKKQQRGRCAPRRRGVVPRRQAVGQPTPRARHPGGGTGAAHPLVAARSSTSRRSCSPPAGSTTSASPSRSVSARPGSCTTSRPSGSSCSPSAGAGGTQRGISRRPKRVVGRPSTPTSARSATTTATRTWSSCSQCCRRRTGHHHRHGSTARTRHRGRQHRTGPARGFPLLRGGCPDPRRSRHHPTAADDEQPAEYGASPATGWKSSSGSTCRRSPPRTTCVTCRRSRTAWATPSPSTGAQAEAGRGQRATPAVSRHRGSNRIRSP
jgi:hypothetical protein